MDDRGFIFTADATLGLIVIVIFATSIMSYLMIPAYMGEDHQHLEAIADSALETMEQDGTLRNATVQAENGNVAGAEQILNNRLQTLIPGGIGYRLTLSSTNTVTVQDERGLLTSRDIVTRVKVITGPQEGWMGRSQYLLEEVNFTDQDITVVSTLWNFHNYLSNYDPWDYNYQLPRRTNLVGAPTWGRDGSTYQNINIPVPNGTLNSVNVLLGSVDHNFGSSYSAIVSINDHNYNIPQSGFTQITDVTMGRIYNNRLTINPGDLTPASSNPLHINFNNVNQYDDMPWFSILANYTMTIKVPQGVSSPVYTTFDDQAGLATRYTRDYNPHDPITTTYDLSTGSVQTTAGSNRVSWDELTDDISALNPTQFSNRVGNRPFVITNVPDVTGAHDGSAVSIVKDVYVPEDTRLLDSYLVVNSFAAADGVLVQVWDEDDDSWLTVFDSSEDTARSHGYGNQPGILFLGDEDHSILQKGHNTVRIVTWDEVPSSDYDLVGLVNCYASVTTTKLPIRWNNTPFENHQSSSNVEQQYKDFPIGPNAESAFLFVGVGTDTNNVKVEVSNNGGGTYRELYNGPVTYVVDLKQEDADNTQHIITDGNDTLLQGNYRLRVTVTAGKAWESGDMGGGSDPSNPISQSRDANAEMFSGTRIAILYPKFLQNLWTTSYAPTADEARTLAYQNLTRILRDSGIPYSDSDIRNESLYTGDLPNTIPVRLSLWKQ